MIKYNSKIWFVHLFSFRKSDTLRMLFWELMIVGIFVGALAYVESRFYEDLSALKDTTMVHSIIGFVLSLLLVFRTNTAYDRWWEGRKLWGSLVNNTRNLAIKLNAFLPEDAKEDKAYFRAMIPNFVTGFRDHLKDGVDLEQLDDVEGILQKLETKEHKLNILISELYKRINKLHQEGHIDGDQLILLDKELKSFTDIMGACERIRNTPIPYSYNIFLKKFILFYLVSLPFGFIAVFEYWAIPITMFIFYVLVSLEVIAEEIEDPFGEDENDLPTVELTEKIKANVQEIFDVG